MALIGYQEEEIQPPTGFHRDHLYIWKMPSRRAKEDIRTFLLHSMYDPYIVFPLLYAREMQNAKSSIVVIGLRVYFKTIYSARNENFYSPTITCINVSDIIVEKGKRQYTLLIPVHSSYRKGLALQPNWESRGQTILLLDKKAKL